MCTNIWVLEIILSYVWPTPSRPSLTKDWRCPDIETEAWGLVSMVSVKSHTSVCTQQLFYDCFQSRESFGQF